MADGSVGNDQFGFNNRNSFGGLPRRSSRPEPVSMAAAPGGVGTSPLVGGEGNAGVGGNMHESHAGAGFMGGGQGMGY